MVPNIPLLVPARLADPRDNHKRSEPRKLVTPRADRQDPPPVSATTSVPTPANLRRACGRDQDTAHRIRRQPPGPACFLDLRRHGARRDDNGEWFHAVSAACFSFSLAAASVPVPRADRSGSESAVRTPARCLLTRPLGEQLIDVREDGALLADSSRFFSKVLREVDWHVVLHSFLVRPFL